MLGLRYLVCPDCGTVYAFPEGWPSSEACERCGAAGLEPLRSDPVAAAYFTAGLGNDAESQDV